MTLSIACFLIYGLKLHWSWYIIATTLWLVKKTGTRLTVTNINPKIEEDGNSPHETKSK